METWNSGRSARASERSEPPAGDEARGLRYWRADRAIRALASRQHGVVAREQILAAGVSPQVLARRIRAKLLEPLHRGVYLVDVVASLPARARAAAYACGARAVVSHISAAALWALLPSSGRAIPIDIILPLGDRRRPGIRIHRVRGLRPEEVATRDGIPITTPARTLLDLAATAVLRDLERALVEPLGRRLTTCEKLGDLLLRHSAHAGTARLRSLLGTGELALTRSEAEKRFLGLMKAGGIRRPQINAKIDGIEVDAVWRRERVVVEIDGKAFHSTGGRIATDTRRDLALAAAGYRVIRIPSGRIANGAEMVLVQVAQALALASEESRTHRAP